MAPEHLDRLGLTLKYFRWNPLRYRFLDLSPMSSDERSPYFLCDVNGSFRHGPGPAAEEVHMLIQSRAVLMIAAAAVMATGAMLAAPAADDAKFKSAVQNAYTKNLNNKDGKNADYIPALAKVDPKIFGLALVTVDGRVYTAGDMKSEVSIQSISKVFTLALVLEQMGPEAVEKNIGVDATGQAFNSIVAIEQYRGSEMNPLVNPGAITATSMVKGANRDAIWKSIQSYYGDFAGRPLMVNQEVYKSEADTNQRNQALAALMYAYGHIKENPAQATDIYTQQCSISVNARDLAIMAATLANGGKNPITGKVVMKPENVPEVLAVMATAGLYDDSGKWLYKTGLPAKSGVGGGIIAVAPGKFGIAAIAPPLDTAGNSVKGQLAIEDLVRALGANPYDVKPVAAAQTASK
jgi:glutaminase